MPKVTQPERGMGRAPREEQFQEGLEQRSASQTLGCPLPSPLGGRWERGYPAGSPASLTPWVHTHHPLGPPLFLCKMGGCQDCVGPREAWSAALGRVLSTEPYPLLGWPPARYSLTLKSLPPFPQGCLLSCQLLLALLALKGQHWALETDLESEKTPFINHFPGTLPTP